LQPVVATKMQAKGKDETPVLSGDSNDKRLKQLRKKLDQIAKLKEKRDRGETLEQNQVSHYIFKSTQSNFVFVSAIVVNQIRNRTRNIG